MESWNGQPAKFASCKLDGWCAEWCNGKLRSRTGKVLRPPRVSWLLQLHLLPADIEVAGELYLHGGCASDVSHALATGNDSLRFAVWDCSALARGVHLGRLEAWAASHGLETPDYWPVASMPRSLPSGVEGWVFSDGLGVNVRKWKPVHTADLRVVGLIEGQGKHQGRIGALVVADASGRVVANVGTGLSDSDREAGGWLGRLVEVRYQCVGSGGKLRHPAFVRARDDKSEADLL